MARARKWTDEQRQAMYELHIAGLDSNDIAARLLANDAGLAEPCDVPARSIRQIVKQMSEARSNTAPGSLSEAEREELPERVGKRVSRMIHAELDRLERKQVSQAGLSLDDINRIDRLRAMAERIARSRGRSSSSSKQEGKRSKRKASELDRLASSGVSERRPAHIPDTEPTNDLRMERRHGGTPSAPVSTPPLEPEQ